MPHEGCSLADLFTFWNVTASILDKDSQEMVIKVMAEKLGCFDERQISLLNVKEEV